MDKSYSSSPPDPLLSLMSVEPDDSCTQVTVSSNPELPSAARSGGLSSLASSERISHQSDSGDGSKDELDEWRKVSYFNPMTGTSIIKITSEMFKKSKANLVQSERDSSVVFKDSNQRCSCEVDSRNSCGGRCGEHPGNEALLSSGMSSTGGGSSDEHGCSRSSESVHFGHSLDIFGDEKVEFDNDKSDILFIDEPDYAYEEKVIDMDIDKEEETAWESFVTHETKKPIDNLKDGDSVDVFKHRSFSAAQLPRRESPLQFDNEKLRSDPSGGCAYNQSGTETGFDDYAAVDVVENDYRCNVAKDHNKTTNISSLSKSLNVDAVDGKPKTSPGPLRLTRPAKSTTAQPEISYSVSTPSFFSAYHPSDVNINNNTRQTSVTNILSLGSQSSNRDETKGWTRDRGSFAQDFLPESSSISDSWAELEDLPSQSFEMSPEKVSVDDLSLSKSDVQGTSDHTEAYGATASHQAHSETNQLEVGQVQSEKLRLMQSRKEKKLSRLKAGVIDSREICGNKGNRSIEELLEFINSNKTEHGKSKKTSQKAKKQRVAPPPSHSRLNFRIQVTVTDEILYNWQSPDAASAVPNGFMSDEHAGDVTGGESCVKVIEESTDDSFTVTVLGTTANAFATHGKSRECVDTVSRSETSLSSNGCEAQEESTKCAETVRKLEASLDTNGFEAQEESKDCTETVSKPEESPSLADAVCTIANGFQERRELEGTVQVGKRNKKENSGFQASSVVPSHIVPEQASTDAVTMTSSSSLKSASDSSSEALATDDNDSSSNFTVVQKRKRNKNTHVERIQSHKATTESSLEFRSKVHYGRQVDNSPKAAFPSKHPQQYRKSTVDNRHPVHPAWGALLKVRPTKGEFLGKNSSGDSSETSSVCSASIQRESTSFAKVALGSTTSDAISQNVCKDSETPITLHRSEARTLQLAKDSCELQQNTDAACGDGSNIEPAVPSRSADHCLSSSQDTVVVPPTGTDDVLNRRNDCSTFPDTVLGGGSSIVSLPSGSVASCQDSTSYQETTLSSAAAGESSTRALGRSSVVFDTREKSRFLAPPSDIEISFGFDDEGATEADAGGSDSTAGVATISSMHPSQTIPESGGCIATVDINSNLPLFQCSANKSAVIAFPGHGFQPIYGSPHPLSLGVGYVVPVPVGIVPPFITCSNRPAAVVPNPAFKSKDFLSPMPEFSVESSYQKQEERGAGVCVPTPAWLMVSSVPQELTSNRCPPPSSKLERRSNCFDLVAAQAFLGSEFEAATSSGSGIIHLIIDD